MCLKDKLYNLLKDSSSSVFASKLKKHPEIYNELLSKTKHLNLKTLNEKIFFILNELLFVPKCLSCDKDVKFISFSKGYRLYCSSECSKHSELSLTKRTTTIMNKYGVENIMELDSVKEKIKETNLLKYGTAHHNQNKEIKESNKQNLIAKYGVDNISKIDFVKEKKELTMYNKFGAKTNLISNKEEYKQILIDKYNVTNPFKSDEIKNKIKKIIKDKYGVEYFSQSKEFKINKHKSILKKLDIYLKYFNLKRNFKDEDYNGSYILENNYKKIIKYPFICLSCKKEFYSGLSDGRYPNSCPKCQKTIGVSSYEHNLEEFLKNYNIEYVKNDRTIINPFEIDFYFPKLNLGIEINGLYYHSFEHLNKSNISNINYYLEEKLAPNKGKNFHLLKSKLCEKQGIFLFHINENEFVLKNDLIKSMILNKLHLNKRKENARDLEIKLVDNKIKKEFLNENHIQGECFSNVDYGLYKGEELLSLMTFSKVRFENNTEEKNIYELIRFCNKKGVSIRGAASKLLKHFLRQIEKGSEIVSFADKRYSNGNVYRELGFKEEYIIGPQQKYFKGLTIYNRMFFQKKNIKQMYEDFQDNKVNKINFGLIKFYNEELTAEENMYLNGFYSIYDCGLIKFRIINN